MMLELKLTFIITGVLSTRHMSMTSGRIAPKKQRFFHQFASELCFIEIDLQANKNEIFINFDSCCHCKR